VPTPAVRDPDQLSYTARQVRAILPRAIAYKAWGIPPHRIELDGFRSRADPAHAGDGTAEILDVLRALQRSGISRAARRVILRVYGQGLTLTEAADAEGITRAEALTLWSVGTADLAAWLSRRPASAPAPLPAISTREGSLPLEDSPGSRGGRSPLDDSSPPSTRAGRGGEESRSLPPGGGGGGSLSAAGSRERGKSTPRRCHVQAPYLPSSLPSPPPTTTEHKVHTSSPGEQVPSSFPQIMHVIFPIYPSPFSSSLSSSSPYLFVRTILLHEHNP
jgi:hypothetical protein